MAEYTALTVIVAVDIKKGNRSLESIKFPTLYEQVEKLLNDKPELVKIFASRVMENVETMTSVPEDLREDVDNLLGKQSISTLLYVADLIDGNITIDDVPTVIREKVIAEVERFVGKKIV